MIATSILVVKCDGCGTNDIFNAVTVERGERGSAVASLEIKPDDLKREGWVVDSLGFGVRHFCPLCQAAKSMEAK